MPEMTKHEPGMFCWADLATTDPAGAKAFYAALLGWEMRDLPIPGGVYTMAVLRGRDVAALSELDPESRAQGVPPHWNAYIAVKNADDTARMAPAVHGKVVVPTMDVMGEGRMAVIQDPTGAMLCVWQPQRHIGAGRMNEPGALCWAELMTRDTKAAGDFYSKVFGWARNEMDMEHGRYTVFAVGQQPAVGMMPMPVEAGDAPNSWMIYVQVADCDATVARTGQLGGQVLVPPKEAKGVGRFAVLQDPQGAVFGVLQSRM